MIGELVLLEKYRENSESDPSLKILMTKIKLRRLSEVFCEILKLKEGLTQHKCQLRNLLQVLIGEMEIYCKIDITNEVNLLLEIVESGINENKWNQIVVTMVQIYEKFFNYCK
ncbi:MAG: hypothetical protein ACTSQ4_10755 [Candidatus Heimdallarchaeaceae archaeon]